MISSKSFFHISIAEDLRTKRRSIRSQEAPTPSTACSTNSTPRAHGSSECLSHSGPSNSALCSLLSPSSSGYVPIADPKRTQASLLLSPLLLTPTHPIGPNSANIVILITSAICTIVAVVEIILFAATRLDPLTNLILQLAKAITWLVLFVQAAVATTPVQNELEPEDEQGYSLGSREEYFYLQCFAEPLVLL